MKATERFTIRAYCDKCGKMLMESNPTSKKQLKQYWDEAVMQAPLCIFCKDCFPDAKINFNLTFKIYDKLKNLEHPVDYYFKSKLSDKDYDAFRNRSVAEDAINSNPDLTRKEKFELTLGMRRNYNKSLQ